jgi:hypothetical protein
MKSKVMRWTREMNTEFRWGNVMNRDQFEFLRVNAVLKRTLMAQNGKEWSGFMWLRVAGSYLSCFYLFLDFSCGAHFTDRTWWCQLAKRASKQWDLITWTCILYTLQSHWRQALLFCFLKFRMAVCEPFCVTLAVSVICYFDTVGAVCRLSAVTTVASGYSVYVISW